TLNAATMLGQSKTAFQAEIDAACELVDFLRFNVHFASRLAEQPISPAGVRNSLELRPLEGFVLAITPFNFTAIAGNLPAAPALLGNVVVWKPAETQSLAAHHTMRLFEAAGLPAGVINVVYGHGEPVARVCLDDPHLAGIHFTGSTRVFQALFRGVGERVERYRSYPRIVGETGGKDFVFAHPSADVDALAVGLVRGAYEFQGQKCSAASRAYVPRSLWPRLRERVLAHIAEIRMGDVADFRNFMGAVIDQRAFARLSSWQGRLAADAGCKVLAGGKASDAEGWFVEPTLVEVDDPRHAVMQEELFGPLLSLFVYDDARIDETLAAIDDTSPYALTGAIFALAAWLLVLRWRGWTGDPLRLAHLGVAQAFAAAMIALSGIDFDHRILPDRITKPGMAAGFLASLLLPRLQSPSGSWGIPPAGEAAVLSAAGMVLGYGLLWGVGWLGERVFRREAMGLGDCKLLAMIGAFAGPGGVLLAAGAGMVLGLLLGAVQHLRTRDAAFPFGPALAAGGLGAVLARRELLEGYHRAQDLMADPRGGLLLAALCTGLLLWIRGRLPRGVFLGLLVLMLVMAGLNLALLAAAPG
ncbi:MAG: aldehyde dehydrogenase family protein, partial [Planctomycetaceae bacterium]|nr:aldehyde dehydrogenase family protein [Planctomycetaceae bacterium]